VSITSTDWAVVAASVSASVFSIGGAFWLDTKRAKRLARIAKPNELKRACAHPVGKCVSKCGVIVARREVAAFRRQDFNARTSQNASAGFKWSSELSLVHLDALDRTSATGSSTIGTGVFWSSVWFT
jgi:hypothetical protein